MPKFVYFVYSTRNRKDKNNYKYDFYFYVLFILFSKKHILQ